MTKDKREQFSFWKILFEIIKRFNIKVIFQKVKAHSGDIFNDRADILAKLGCNKDRIDIEDNILTERAHLFWFDHIDKNIRQFVKEINNQRINIKLESLNRMKDLSSVRQHGEKPRINIDLSINALTKENSENSKLNYLNIKTNRVVNILQVS